MTREYGRTAWNSQLLRLSILQEALAERTTLPTTLTFWDFDIRKLAIQHSSLL